MEPSTQQSSPAVPIAIICGFAMIAIAIFFTNKNKTEPVPQAVTSTATTELASQGIPKAVTEADYIFGNPNAPILMIEYSDYDCPFCKQYHSTLKQIMDEYGVTGKVAWVYRQFPLPQLHPNSPKISEAALCVGSLGGNQAFWDFSQRVYDSRDVDEATNIVKLPEFAKELGISESDYSACIKDAKMQQAVVDSIADGINVGAQNGTPHTVLVVGDQQTTISGAQSYEFVKGIVENLIGQLEGNVDPTTPVPVENDAGVVTE